MEFSEALKRKRKPATMETAEPQGLAASGGVGSIAFGALNAKTPDDEQPTDEVGQIREKKKKQYEEAISKIKELSDRHDMLRKEIYKLENPKNSGNKNFNAQDAATLKTLSMVAEDDKRQVEEPSQEDETNSSKRMAIEELKAFAKKNPNWHK